MSNIRSMSQADIAEAAALLRLSRLRKVEPTAWAEFISKAWEASQEGLPKKSGPILGD